MLVIVNSMQQSMSEKNDNNHMVIVLRICY